MVSQSTAESLRDLLSLGTDIAVRQETQAAIDKAGQRHATDLLQSNLKTTFEESGHNPELLQRVSNQATFGSINSNIQAWGNKINLEASKQTNLDPTAYSQSLAQDTYSLVKAIDTTTTGEQRRALYNTLDKQIQRAQEIQLEGNIKYTSSVARNQTYANVGSILDYSKVLPTEQAAMEMDNQIDVYREGTQLDDNELMKAFSDSLLGRVADGELNLAEALKTSKYKDWINAETLRKSIKTGQDAVHNRQRAQDDPASLKASDQAALFEEKMDEYIKANPGVSPTNFLMDNTLLLSKFSPDFFKDYLGFDSVQLSMSPGSPQRNNEVNANRERFIEYTAALNAGGMSWTRIKQKLKGSPNLSAVIDAIGNKQQMQAAFANMDLKQERATLEGIPGGKAIEQRRDELTNHVLDRLTKRVTDAGVKGFFGTIMDSVGAVSEPFFEADRDVQTTVNVDRSAYYSILRSALNRRIEVDPTFDPTDEGDLETFITDNFVVDAVGDSVAFTDRNTTEKTFNGERSRWETKEYVDTFMNNNVKPALAEAMSHLDIRFGATDNTNYTIYRKTDNKTMELTLNIRNGREKGTIKARTGIYQQDDGTWGVMTPQEYAAHKQNPSAFGRTVTDAGMLWRMTLERNEDGLFKPGMKLATQEELTRYYNGEMEASEASVWRQTTGIGGFALTPDDLNMFIKNQQSYESLNSIGNKIKTGAYDMLGNISVQGLKVNLSKLSARDAQ